MANPPAQTAKKTQKKARRCAACQLKKPWEAFDRRPTGTGRGMARCRQCRQAKIAAKLAPPHIEAGPCQLCGLPYKVRTHYEKGIRKVCGLACADRVRRKPKTCSRCSETKPADDFSSNPLTKWRRAYCKKCEDRDLASRGPAKSWARPTLLRVQQYTKGRARAAGVKWATTTGKIRQIYNNGCALCGLPVTTIRQIDPKADAAPDNLRGFCRYCADLARSRSFTDLVSLGHLIARHCPKEGQPHAADPRLDPKPSPAVTDPGPARDVRPSASSWRRRCGGPPIGHSGGQA